MRRRTGWILAVATVAAIVAALLASSADHASARSDQASASAEPSARNLPVAARNQPGVGSPEYQSAADGAEHPGATAFRGYTDAFVDSQPDELAANMAREKISERETRELTYFALLAKTSLDWDAVEEITGHPIEDNARKYATQAMFAASEEMKKELRADVAAGKSEAERADTVARVEQGYLDQYDHLTGMTPDLLDWLLWESVQNQRVDALIEDSAPTAPPPSGTDGAQEVDRKLGAQIIPQ